MIKKRLIVEKIEGCSKTYYSEIISIQKEKKTDLMIFFVLFEKLRIRLFKLEIIDQSLGNLK